MLGGGEGGCLTKMEMETDGETDQAERFRKPEEDGEREREVGSV